MPAVTVSAWGSRKAPLAAIEIRRPPARSDLDGLKISWQWSAPQELLSSNRSRRHCPSVQIMDGGLFGHGDCRGPGCPPGQPHDESNSRPANRRIAEHTDHCHGVITSDEEVSKRRTPHTLDRPGPAVRGPIPPVHRVPGIRISFPRRRLRRSHHHLVGRPGNPRRRPRTRPASAGGTASAESSSVRSLACG